MGKKDTAIKVWLGDKARFADLFNGTVFQGEQIIDPAVLEAEDKETQKLINDKDGKLMNIERNRDLVMRWNKSVNFVILACESQDKIHYAMPVRTMIYDGLSYVEQIRQLSKDKHFESADEFLSGIKKEDKLHPVITIVLYYGENEWDGSTDLYELLEDSSDPHIRDVLRKYVPNYHINLLEVNKLENMSLFKTDLQVVLGMLKYRKDKKKIKQYIDENERYFKQIDIDTYNVLRVFLNAEKQLAKIQSQEEVNMCEALQGIYDDGKLEGEQKGISVMVATLKQLGQSNEFIIKTIMDNFDVTESEVEEYVK